MLRNIFISLFSLSFIFSSSLAFALSDDGFYTKKELEEVYQKKYKNKIPYSLAGLATLNEVVIGDDGVVYLNGVVDDIYYQTPKLLRMQAEVKGLEKLEKNYCNKVKAKKNNIDKVREIVATLKNSSGKIEKRISYTPDMCEE
ncbi:MAG: hypothetical protein UHG91_06570 [Succinivibrionaceae bacterium]|nr:hypothetical protein [Ruminobacter sp.]MDY5778668.1 hypothetical protein [Succinivibrionaceae bacterium]MEE1340425.1 hypothetical protein [Succinivibrionaceae bacterium]